MAADGRDSKTANVDPKLLELLACPLTKGPLAWDPERGELISRIAKIAYPVRDGIPIMLPSEARSISAEDVLSPPRLSGPAGRQSVLKASPPRHSLRRADARTVAWAIPTSFADKFAAALIREDQHRVPRG